MKKTFLILALLICGTPTCPQTKVSGNISKVSGSLTLAAATTNISFSSGWTKLPLATTIQGNGFNLCPANGFGGSGYNFSNLCGGTFVAWTSFAFDLAGQNGPRMLNCSNGGHTDYLGNECYEMNLRTGTSLRLNNPSTTFASSCANPDASSPGAGHTYGFNIASMRLNKLYIWARITGDTSGNGCGAFKMWALDLNSVNQACAPSCSSSWSQVTPVGLPSTETIVMASAATDLNTGKIWVWESFNSASQASVSVFDDVANTWTKTAQLSSNATLYGAAGVDTQNQAFVVMGGCNTPGCTLNGSDPAGSFWCDISTGCTTINHPGLDASCTAVNGSTAPALVYDSTRQELVAFSGEVDFQHVYVITVNKGANTITCAAESYGTVQGTSYPEKFNFDNGQTTPMFNKVAYDAADDIYMACPNIDRTCWALKRSPLVRVTNTTASLQTNTPTSVSEVFAKGDIPTFPQAIVNGSFLTTQADVKQRWPDGSVKWAIVSFLMPSLAANATQKVYFTNQATGNNGGSQTQAQLLAAGYNYDSQIQLTGTANRTISAKTILTGCGSIATTTDPSGNANVCRYWLQGPIVTAVILDDRSAARSFDVNVDNGTGNPLHPIFESYFYPSTNSVETFASLENVWSSSTVSKSMRDQTYSLVVTMGNTSPVTVFTRASFKMIGNSRWGKDFCQNGTANGCFPVLIDHNAPYEAFARAIPNYDPGIIIPSAQISGIAATWTGSNQDIVETLTGCDGTGGIGQYCLDMNTGGTSPWFGVLSTWEAYYWFTRWNSGQLAGMQASVLGNSQVGSRIPFHYREADSTVGATNLFYDLTGAVNPVGRTVSINARPKENYMIAGAAGSNFNSTCSGGNPLTLNLGTITDGGWGAGSGSGGMDSSHFPEIAYTAAITTGKFWYVEEAQFVGAYMVSNDKGCSPAETGNPGPWRFGTTGVLYFEQPGRGSAWGTRATMWAWILSPDSTPEQAYFGDKLNNTGVFWAGFYGTGNPDGTRVTAYNAGVSTQDDLVDNVQHMFLEDAVFLESPLDTNAGHLLNGGSPWEWGYQMSVFSQLRDVGMTNWTPLMSYYSKEWIHVALDSNFGNQFMIGTYRIPAKLVSTGKWIQTGADWLAAFTAGNGSGLSTSWTDQTHSQKPCNYSPDDDHWHAAPLATLGYFYPYSDGSLTAHNAYESVRSSLYGSTGCMPQMYNNNSVVSGASPKWDILPRR